MRIKLHHTYADLISLENLLGAWAEFLNGKRNKSDVQLFGRQLMDNIIALHRELCARRYQHGGYVAFAISDPKPRNIHKADVRDRVLHHAVYRQLYPFFDRTFTTDSYSCREHKGTHKALERFQCFSRRVSQNNQQTCWVLKCDITKFFASIDHNILLGILSLYIPDRDTLWLLQRIICSFHSTEPGIGLPLGNLTSQLLVNIYLNEFDQFVKHALKVKYYIRYADDFVLLSHSHDWLEEQKDSIQYFLKECLHLTLHPHKVSIKTLASGVDFLGWIHFSDHRVLRTAAKQRMLQCINRSASPETLQSYRGLLQHGNTYQLQQHALNDYDKNLF